jgi:hypothetical protein
MWFLYKIKINFPRHIGLVVLISRSPQPSKISNCTTSGALLGVSCDSRQGPFLGDSAVLKSRRTTVKKGEKATATLFYLFSTATALYFKKRQRRWHREGSDIQSTQVSVMGLA